MYAILIGMALIMGALNAIIFVNLYRKQRKLSFVFAVFALFGVVYQLFILFGPYLWLALLILAIHSFFIIAALRRVKKENVQEKRI